jgi:hypothetical protein
MGADRAKQVGSNSYVFVYAIPLAFWCLAALTVIDGPEDLFLLIIGPFRLIPTGESVIPAIALPMMTLFGIRPNIITGILSGLGVFAWGLMGFIVISTL